MGIDVLGGTYLGVSQAFGNADWVSAREIKHRGHAVAEFVGMDMGKGAIILYWQHYTFVI